MRGRFCVAAAKCFMKEQPSKDYLKVINLVGWAVELMQAAFLVHDDIIDKSPVRRGRTSWGLLQEEEGYGLIGVNDGLHLYMSVQQLLMSALTSIRHPRCIDIIKVFGDCANSTCFGQALDILGEMHLNVPDASGVSPSKLSRNDKDRLKDISMSRFASIAKWKTSYYSFVLPVVAGMLLADVKNEMLISNAKSILLEIGEYFQAQDDYLDVYGDTEVTGKVGTDIADGKCSWVISTALEKASAVQRSILNSNYGMSDSGCVEAVRKVFDELDIRAIYAAYEDRTRTRISQMIDSMSVEESEDVDFTHPGATKVPRKFFMELLNVFYHRKK
ncbi:hypothetical protein Aperf_G00000067490 [Anoplocephala perfoliata]